MGSHEILEPVPKRLFGHYKFKARVRILQAVKIENDATRKTGDSWADIEKAKKRVRRMIQIHESLKRINQATSNTHE